MCFCLLIGLGMGQFSNPVATHLRINEVEVPSPPRGWGDEKASRDENRMSQLPPFYYGLFLWKFNFKDWVFHSMVIWGSELCKRDGNRIPSLNFTGMRPLSTFNSIKRLSCKR